jgi:hypothetical protein
MQDFLSLLQRTLPERTPMVSTATAFHDAKPLSIKYEMNYEAAWPSSVFLGQLESRLRDSLLTRDSGLVEVPVSAGFWFSRQTVLYCLVIAFRAG